MSRIPYPDPSQLSKEKADFLEKLSPKLNISRMTMHLTDDLWAAWLKYARTVAYEIELEKDVRELLILRVAYLSNSDYEVHHHYHTAISNGATDAKCLAMKSGDFSALNAREAAAAQFVTELIQKVSPSDAALEEMRAHFSINAVFGIILLIGAYMTMARIIATAGIEVEEAE